MKIRILKSEGGGMERDVTEGVKTFLLLVGCLVFVLCGVMAWVLFAPSPRLERAKIAMHDEATFAKLQAKHGKKATEVVIYEEDGQAYYYRGKEKIKFQ